MNFTCKKLCKAFPRSLNTPGKFEELTISHSYICIPFSTFTLGLGKTYDLWHPPTPRSPLHSSAEFHGARAHWHMWSGLGKTIEKLLATRCLARGLPSCYNSTPTPQTQTKPCYRSSLQRKETLLPFADDECDVLRQDTQGTSLVC